MLVDDWGSGIKHIDIWTGNSNSGGENQIQCENKLTPNALQGVIRSPASNLEVDCKRSPIDEDSPQLI